jgi:hypothetical protein
MGERRNGVETNVISIVSWEFTQSSKEKGEPRI